MKHISKLLPIHILWLFCCLTLVGCNDTAAPKKPRKPSEHLIETVFATTQTIAIEESVTSTLQAIRKVRIINQVPGLLTALPVYPGNRVKKGQLLAQLEGSLLRAGVEKAEATLNQNKVAFKRISDLAKQKLSSESELALAKTQYEIAKSDLHLKQTQLAFSRINAPISGVISQRMAEPGDVLAIHSQILTLIDTSKLKTEIHVSELLMPLIKKENAVDVRIDALGGKRFKGKIKRIYPSIDDKTHRGTLEIILSPVPKGAMAGQFCRISIKTMSKQRLMVPFDSVRHDKQGAYVFAVNDNKAKRVNIITGVQQNDLIEVIKGLSDQQQIVSKGLFGLKDDMTVKIISPQTPHTK